MTRGPSLTQRTGRAIGFRLTGSILDAGLATGLGIILARILPPEEFGLFGLTVAIVAIAEMIGSCGLLQALVQRKQLTPEHETAAAIFQFCSALLISSLMFFGAPLTARLFNLPELALIMKLQVGVVLLNAIALLPESRLTRRLAFDRITAIQVSGRTLGGIVTIILAIHGLGALALAIGHLCYEVTRASLLWVCAPGFISLRCRLHHFADLIRYGSGILCIYTTNILARRLDVLIIGRQVGSEAVGLYQRAYQLVLLPLRHATGSVNKVIFPALSSVQDEESRFRRGYLKAVRLSALVAFPLLTALGTSADVIIPFVYGPMWKETVPILQVLAFAGIFRILSNTHGIAAQARARAHAEAARQVLWLILTLILGFFGSMFGVLGVAIGVSLATFIFCISMTRLALSITHVRFIDWLKVMRTGILGSAVMGLSVLLVKNNFNAYVSPLPLIATLVCTGMLAYIAAIRFCSTPEDRELMGSFCGIIPSRPRHVLCSLLGITSADLPHKATGEAVP